MLRKLYQIIHNKVIAICMYTMSIVIIESTTCRCHWPLTFTCQRFSCALVPPLQVRYTTSSDRYPHSHQDMLINTAAQPVWIMISLSQFINNSSNYLIKDTRLIFSPGIYSLESELAVENVHSFCMSVWPGSSSKVVITCGHNARFELGMLAL